MFLSLLLDLLPALIELLIAIINRKKTLSDRQRDQIARARGMWQAADGYCDQIGVAAIPYQHAGMQSMQTLDREAFRAELVGLLNKAAAAPRMFVSDSDKEVIKVAIPVLESKSDDVNACLDMMLAILPASAWLAVLAE